MINKINILIDIRKKRVLIPLLFIIVLLFTTANNYFFYAYVGSSVKRDARQLELLLKEDLKYFRDNKISAKKYRAHTRMMVEKFSENAQYNKSIMLNYENAITKNGGKFKKGYESWKFINPKDRVSQSHISILIPRLHSDNNLSYKVIKNEVGFLNKEFLISIFKSMTLSFTDVVFRDTPKEGILVGLKKWWKYYRYRSHNPMIFLIVLLPLFYRIRKYQIELYNEIDRLEKMIPKNNNKDIQAIMNCLEKQDTKKLNSLIKAGLNIDSKDSEGMTALMQYMLTDKSDKDKRKVIKILLDNGANINERNNVGMTPLMICAQKDKKTSVEILLENKADTTIKQELTAKDIATQSIKDMISKTQNTYPQELVKILSNFTHKPMKFTTHIWDFGSLASTLGTFDEAMEAVRKQFNSIDAELKDLSKNLHKKISIFLFNKDSSIQDSWCSKTNISIGWLSLEGLKEWCDDGNSAFDFIIQDPIVIDNNELNTFGEIINLFKQEIEMRIDFNNLEQIFSSEKKKLGRSFKLNLIDSKLQRQFYTDTESLSFAIKKIFIEIKKRVDYPNIEVSTKEFEDRSLEIKIIQIGSSVDKNSKILADEIKSGDFFDIKEALNNLCDWSIESVCEDGSFRINYLHSNNVQDIEAIENVTGFSHILRFYR